MSSELSSGIFDTQELESNIILHSRLFQTRLFDKYIASLVRSHIIQCFVDANHQVLIDEQNMMACMTSKMKSYIDSSSRGCNLSHHIVKKVIVRYVKYAAEQRISLHEIDEETQQSVLKSIHETDFSGIFPNEWTDN